MEGRSAGEIWEATLGEIEIQVSKPNYHTWFAKTKGLSNEKNGFTVVVPNTFVAEYLDKKQRSLIERTLISITHQQLKVKFSVLSQHFGEGEEPTSLTRADTPRFNPKYTFDSFVVGDSNRLAYAAALGVAENQGSNFNPLFIYGGAGLGKTHLLHAIANMAQNSQKILYVSAEQFANEFINSIRERETAQFRRKYRDVDMLLIDDIHFFVGKEQTQESFFHTFNDLHNGNRQIILTSDCPPKSMPLLKERLRSRFEWGLIVDIKPPDFETRRAILKTKAEQHGVNVTPDVLEFIAHAIRQNIRELEGSLNRVVAYSRLLRTLITPELAAQALDNISSKAPESTAFTPKLLMETVANSFQIPLADLKSRKRDRETALARHITMYLLKQETDFPLSQIGKELGGRDHSTVIHACEKIANSINHDPSLRQKIQQIKRELYPNRKPNEFTP